MHPNHAISYENALHGEQVGKGTSIIIGLVAPLLGIYGSAYWTLHGSGMTGSSQV